jgi:hypothetical protein
MSTVTVLFLPFSVKNGQHGKGVYWLEYARLRRVHIRHESRIRRILIPLHMAVLCVRVRGWGGGGGL